MNTNDLEQPEEWAIKTFAPAELGDPRRTDRLVRMAAALAEEPAASLRKRDAQRERDARGLPLPGHAGDQP
jgi:hypothetical protein